MEITVQEIVILIVTFIVGLYANILYQKLESKEVIKQNLHKEKLQLYLKINKSISQAAIQPTYTSQTVGKYIEETSALLVNNGLIFPNDVIVLISRFTVNFQEFLKTSNDFDVMGEATKVITAMRKDLGIEKLSYELDKILQSSRKK